MYFTSSRRPLVHYVSQKAARQTIKRVFKFPYAPWQRWLRSTHWIQSEGKTKGSPCTTAPSKECNPSPPPHKEVMKAAATSCFYSAEPRINRYPASDIGGKIVPSWPTIPYPTWMPNPFSKPSPLKGIIASGGREFLNLSLHSVHQEKLITSWLEDCRMLLMGLSEDSAGTSVSSKQSSKATKWDLQMWSHDTRPSSCAIQSTGVYVSSLKWRGIRESEGRPPPM